MRASRGSLVYVYLWFCATTQVWSWLLDTRGAGAEATREAELAWQTDRVVLSPTFERALALTAEGPLSIVCDQSCLARCPSSAYRKRSCFWQEYAVFPILASACAVRVGTRRTPGERGWNRIVHCLPVHRQLGALRSASSHAVASGKICARHVQARTSNCIPRRPESSSNK